MERLIEHAAHVIGMDAAEIRRRNLIPTAKLPYTTPTHWVYDSGEFTRLMDRCIELGDPDGFAARKKATEKRGKPIMAYHMWTEVWVQGQWLAIDATLGQGAIGAAHVKIADHSWYDTHSLTPLLSVARVLDKLSIEVVSVNGTP